MSHFDENVVCRLFGCAATHARRPAAHAARVLPAAKLLRPPGAHAAGAYVGARRGGRLSARAPRRFEDVHEYYHDSSSQNYIPYVHTPSLFLVAADDPFLGRLPRAECLANPHTLLAVTPWCASRAARPERLPSTPHGRVGGLYWGR